MAQATPVVDEASIMTDYIAILEAALTDVNFRKLLAIPNRRVHRFVAEAIELCKPMKVFVCNDSRMDTEYIRRTAIARGEETPLSNPYHTVHFDGFYDQARDKERTLYLVPEGESLGEQLAQMDREKGLKMVQDRMDGNMEHKKMVVRFFCLGPLDSPFSIPCVQITDSFYVAHSEDLLYRRGYEYFRRLPEDREIFWMLHSSGKLIHAVSTDWKKRGVAIDYKENTVYSFNTQYAGNTIGLKKLALRLAIRKADREGWLAEHMFLMGVKGPGSRKTYFTGAFPSGCGKTSTSMVRGTTIVGDDLAYLRPIDGRIRAVNVERGIFGIIRSVNERDDPLIWDVLHSQVPAIFSNVLITEDAEPRWLGDGQDLPKRGVNHSGQWFEGRVDENGHEIPYAHKNARYTIRLPDLPNMDEQIDDPRGVVVGGIIYGGRDPDTWVPVQEAFDWEHGVITMGASLESETTAATLGPSGVRKFNPFSNMDFVSIPIGQYIQNHLDFGGTVDILPRIFSVNYFLTDADGNYISDKQDKRVWLQWMELRAHGEIDAIETPTGYLPHYEDLSKLFQKHLDKDFSREEYDTLFTIRIPQLLEKNERIQTIYKENVQDTPDRLFEILGKQHARLKEAQEKYGEFIHPEKFLH
ncbi:MAG: Phosphoenolpyruvate carboxykinase [GTP] [Candidatus Thorarchaeota archaeon]|nr:MAG: Phosphoenolpyruvate carboxykinase [GTP] [Candidatus Thorarchaeota archaeon]